MSPIPLVIDSDVGPDDAFAIAMALGHPARIDLLGITTVAGNLPLDEVTAAALRLVALAGRAIPVVAGAARPLVAAPVDATSAYAEAVRRAMRLPEAAIAATPGFAPDWLVDTAMARPANTLTVCALGPLTNLALALEREPRLAPRLARIVLMGGAHAVGGNMNAVAEFNIHVDPHAAERVFASGVPLVVLPLDVTVRTLLTAQWLARLRALDTGVTRGFAAIVRYYDRQLATLPHGVPLHDPTTIGWLLDPAAFTTEDVFVEIDTRDGFSRGQTVLDRERTPARAANALWTVGVDGTAFFENLLAAFGNLP